jgi:hypothetical protein
LIQVSHFHVPFEYYKSTNSLLQECYAYDISLCVAKIWPNSKTISKGRANNSLQWGLASKEFQNMKYVIDIQSTTIGIASIVEPWTNDI